MTVICKDDRMFEKMQSAYIAQVARDLFECRIDSVTAKERIKKIDLLRAEYLRGKEEAKTHMSMINIL